MSIQARVDNGVLRVQINRPEQRNALSLAVLESLGEVFYGTASDTSLRAAVLTGAGDKSFAAGGDLKELNSMRSDADAYRVANVGRTALNAIRAFPVPVVAAVNGIAVGGGAELAMACDFRVAVPSAKIGFVQGLLNISTAWGGASDLVAVLGPTRGLELLVSSRVLSASEALSIGLFDQICPASTSLIDAVDAYIEPWLVKPAHVVRALSAVSRNCKNILQGSCANIENDCFVSTWSHDAHWQAAAAILVKSGSG